MKTQRSTERSTGGPRDGPTVHGARNSWRWCPQPGCLQDEGVSLGGFSHANQCWGFYFTRHADKSTQTLPPERLRKHSQAHTPATKNLRGPSRSFALLEVPATGLAETHAPPLHVADHGAERVRADARNSATETPGKHATSLRVAVGELAFLLAQAGVDLAPERVVCLLGTRLAVASGLIFGMPRKPSCVLGSRWME